MSYKCVNTSTIECTRRGRQPGDPSGEAALAPLKGELAARTGCLKRPQALCKRATAAGGT